MKLSFDYTTHTTITGAVRERNPPATLKFETKVIRDSNLDFWINLDPELDVRRIRPKMWCIMLSASVISQSMVQIGRRLYDKC